MLSFMASKFIWPGPRAEIDFKITVSHAKFLPKNTEIYNKYFTWIEGFIGAGFISI